MINNVVLVGRIANDPEVNTTRNDKKVASFRLAVEDDWKRGEDGKKETDFLTIVAWEKTAEIIEQYTSKGALIAVEGKIKTRSYMAKGAEKATWVVEILAKNVRLLESRGERERREAEASGAGGGSGSRGSSQGQQESWDDEDVFGDK